MKGDTLQIGMIGHPALLHQNALYFQQVRTYTPEYEHLRICTMPIYNSMQLALLDGLLLTGWYAPSLYCMIAPLRQSILNRVDSLSLWGIASGAAMLGRNGIVPIIDCDITSRAKHTLTTSILEFPEDTPKRFAASFVPQIRFASPAPNLGILCQNHAHGIVAIRQGNYLASSFVAELTPQLYLYQYWLEMVLRLKEWQI